MKKLGLIVLAILFGLNIHAQRRGGNLNRIPQTQSEPTEEQMAKREREIEERKEEYVDNFLTTLEADEFQKHIIKQNIMSFFEAKLAILKTRFEHYLEREQAIKTLEENHFKDLKALITEKDMARIDALIKGEFDEKEVVKKKRKKEKKRKRKKNKD